MASDSFRHRETRDFAVHAIEPNDMLVGIFAVCGFVFHNYVNLNIGPRLTLLQAVAFFIQWTLIGLVIGLIHKPTEAR